jgi:hypothetical protein
VPLRRGFLVHARLAALLLLQLLLQLLSSADDAGIAVVVRAEHSVRVLRPVRSSLGLSGPAILVVFIVFNATRLMLSKIVEQAAATCKALASQNNQNQRRLLVKEDWPFNNQGPEWSAAPVRSKVSTDEDEWRMAGGGRHTAWALFDGMPFAPVFMREPRALQPKSSGHFVLGASRIGHRASGQAPAPGFIEGFEAGSVSWWLLF